MLAFRATVSFSISAFASTFQTWHTRNDLDVTWVYVLLLWISFSRSHTAYPVPHWNQSDCVILISALDSWCFQTSNTSQDQGHTSSIADVRVNWVCFALKLKAAFRYRFGSAEASPSTSCAAECLNAAVTIMSNVSLCRYFMLSYQAWRNSSALILPSLWEQQAAVADRRVCKLAQRQSTLRCDRAASRKWLTVCKYAFIKWNL